MPFKIIRNDITKMETDAVVNAANCGLYPGGGVCGAIFSAAGYEKLTEACLKIGGCKTGKAVITPGFDLPAKYIIHTPGPVYMGGKNGEEKLLYSCYKESLKLAEENGAKSIAFPLISSGIYGYPKTEALRIAEKAILDFLEKSDMEVYLIVYDKEALGISEKLFSKIEKYIDDNMIVKENRERRFTESPVMSAFAAASAVKPMYKAEPDLSADFDIDELIKMKEKTFSESLFELIDKSGMTDTEVYKKANIDRRLFSKIRSNKDYKPAKKTVLAFAIALKLNIKETRHLLETAGYALSRSSRADIIVEYFIKQKKYNIFDINEALFAFDEPLIGA